MLHRLSTDDERTRRRVASNVGAPVATFAALTCDRSSDVRFHLAKNAAVPAEVLMVLADDYDVDVRRAVLNHPSAPATVRERESQRLIRIASDPATDPYDLLEMAGHKDERVRAAVLANGSYVTDLSRRPPETMRD